MALGVGLLSVLPAVASADVSFCPAGQNAEQCDDPFGVAADTETGRVYVADQSNNRINVFKSDGTFVLAFGWGVDDGTAALQTCTTASGCQKGLAGSGTGQLSTPRAIAVDNVVGSTARHDIYVVSNDARVQRFGPEGQFRLGFGWGVATGDAEAQTCGPGALPPTVTCGPGIGGSGKCQISRGTDPVAVGPGGSVFIGDTAGNEPNFKGRIEEFSPAGACIDETILFEAENRVLKSLAVDSGANAYVSLERDDQEIRKYGSGSAIPSCEFDQGYLTSSLAIDPTNDHLYSAQREEGAKPSRFFRVITEYDASCNHVRRLAYGALQDRPVLGIAIFHSLGGDIFASEDTFFDSEGKEAVHYLTLPPPPPGPLAVAPSVEAFAISSSKATLYGEINPEGKASKYHFDYVDEATYLKDVAELGPGHGFDHAKRLPANESEDASAGSDFKLHAAETLAGCLDPVTEAPGGKCLTPETKYRFRLVAKNADGESQAEGQFETEPQIVFGELWSTSVGVDTARLHGEVNPLGVPATGFFEYVSDATYQKDVKELGPGHGFDHAKQSPNVSGGETPIDFGDAEDPTERSSLLFPLAPGTTYHYRLVASDPLTEVVSEEETFRTFAKPDIEDCPANEAFRTGSSALLPDCRAYEMVSPLEKDNGDILVLGETFSSLPAVLNQSALSGSKLAYGTYRAFGDAKAGPYTSQYIAARDQGAEEWVSHAISPPRERRLYTEVISSLDTEFKLFSPDLCESWLRTIFDPPLAPGGIEGYPDLYRGVDEECSGGPSYEALTTAAWQNLALGNAQSTKLELQGVSADRSHAVYVAPDTLVGTGAPNLGGDQFQLYVWAGGPSPVFACVLPGGAALNGPCSAGTNSKIGIGKNRSANLQGAISKDGSRLFWTAAGTGEGKIYMREHAEQGQVGGECSGGGVACTIEVSKAGEEASGTTSSRFLAAASDGSRAVFSTSKAGVEDLYEFDVATKTTSLIAHHALPGLGAGIMGTSGDLSRIYFASTDDLGGENSEGEEPAAGKPNLYLDEGGEIDFVGTLTNLDVFRNPIFSPVSREPLSHLARVSPDGAHAAFMSTAQLTGYDNTDAKNGEADAEVFLYDAMADGGEGELVCASCNPSGSRPVGENIGGKAAQFWAAAQIPVFQNTFYAARVLSDNGSRLFFESSDVLAARDTNGKRDVYQWEEAGSGGCEAGDASFSGASGGCIDLISSGQSSKGSEITDISPSGNDVFFTTLSSLLSQDYGLVDVYDARVGGGFTPPPPPKEPCEGEACQSPPAPPVAPTPASSVGGPGQVIASPPKPCPKGKKRVQRKGKSQCVAKKPGKSKKGTKKRTNQRRQER